MKIRIAIPDGEYLPLYHKCSIASNLKSHKKCPLPGLYPEILRDVLWRTNLTYQVVGMKDIDMGETINGTSQFTDILGQLAQGQFDTLVHPVFNTATRRAFFYISYPLHNSHYVFLCKKIQHDNYLFSLFKPFSLIMWFNVVACLLIFLLSWICLSAYSPKVSFGLGKCLDFLRGAGSEKSLSPNCASKKIYFISFSLFVLIFGSLYQGFMLLGFARNSYDQVTYTFDNVLSLLEKGHLHIVNNNNWAFIENIRADQDIAFRRLGNILKNRKVLKVSNNEEAISLVRTGKYLYPTNDVTAKLYTAHYCDLSVITIEDYVEQAVYILSKNNSNGKLLLDLLNKAIIESWPAVEYYERKYKNFNYMKHCESDLGKSKQSLSLNNISGAFILLCTGLVIAFSMLIYESLKC